MQIASQEHDLLYINWYARDSYQKVNYKKIQIHDFQKIRNVTIKKSIEIFDHLKY